MPSSGGASFNNLQIEESESQEKGNDSSKTFLKIAGIFAAVAVLVLVIVLPVYFTVIEPNNEGTEGEPEVTEPPIIADEERVDCFPDNNEVTLELCQGRGCVWSPNDDSNAPPCVYAGPRAYMIEGEPVETSSDITSTVLTSDNALNHFGELFSKLTVKTTYVSSTTLRVKIYPESERFEVPMDHPAFIDKPSDALYSVQHVTDDEKFGVKVERAGTNKILFDTSIGEMMFADQFLQITTRVASDYVYGFGEHMHETFKHNMDWKTYGMFSRDQGVGTNVNLYGVHPYFMCMEGDGDAYGVYFVNSNAMDVTLQPAPAITYRSVGGVMDFYIFLGPSPEQVTEQYTAVIGRPYFPPYWSLGFQLCRYGYENLDNLTRVVNRNLGKIPYEIQYSDIDYMERQLDFTIDSEAYGGLEEFVENLKEDYKMRYIIILDPAISGNETAGSYPPYDNGIRDDVFIKSPDGGVAWGKVWPDFPNVTVDDTQDWEYQTENYRAFAAFPDFYRESTHEWWTNLTVEFHDRIKFDGLWIDMNEPASFVHGSPNGCPSDSPLDNPPYVPHLASGNLYDKTLCMQSKQSRPGNNAADQDHYNMHSLYGLSQTKPTLDACRESTGERCIVISRSTYPGSGKYVGHWLGDNASVWSHLGASIIGMLEFNLFGIPYVGADVCGFFVDTTEQLCRRWMQLGAFYPFDRNHNGIGWADQDPGSFGDEFLSVSKKILDVRYTLLPYLYTLFYEAQKTGATVVRPMMNQFPYDTDTYTIDKQFLWGPALLITAVLDADATSVDGYFPIGRWFNYYNGEELEDSDMKRTETLDTPMDEINLHLYGGHIIPTQDPALTTYYSRQNLFGLIVTLDEQDMASGELFWDDGTSIDTIGRMEYTLIKFSCGMGLLGSEILHSNTPSEAMTLGKVQVFGLSGQVTRVLVDGVEHTNFTYVSASMSCQINGLMLDMKDRFEIRWEINNEWKRYDCMPSKAEEPTKTKCEDRGCVWDDTVALDDTIAPLCYYADDEETRPSYMMTSRLSSDSYTLQRDERTSQRYGTPVKTLQFDIGYQTNNRFHFKIKDSSAFEIPPELNNFPTTIESDDVSANYKFRILSDPFGIEVSRKSTGKIVFDTSIGPLVYEDKYLEISTMLPSELVFGLGEHNHRRYRHDLNWKRWAIFSRDVAPVDEWNLYGHQTFYMAVDDIESGTAVGVYLHNSNAMDVLLTPEPSLTYKIVGGVMNFYLFFGNSQEEVVQQFHNFIGLPMMPPYWGLGFQLSRWNYNSLDRVKEVVQEMRDAEIPFDVQYGDIDYMENYKSFTFDEDLYNGLPAYVDQLHDWGMRYIIILDPGIKIEDGYKAYEDGIAADIYIKHPNGSNLVTEVWPGKTHHPDYTHPNCTNWWKEQCFDFYENQGVRYDALWIDMNEPANFEPDDPDKLANMNCGDEYNRTPYMPNILWYGIGLHDKTICMENDQYLGKHYDLHSLYGHTMSMATYQALEEILPNERSMVLTRSTFTGTGKYAGHWLGDNQSRWKQMAWPIPAMFEFNLFGFPYIGADVCGFWYNTTAEMCQRWMQVGAFYPFSRNHNAAGMIPQHPTAFGDDVTQSSKDVLEIRYSILPYMYTLHYQASTSGGTVVRALVHEFSYDKNTWDADRQFLLGSGFLITPVLDEGMDRVTGYFPGGARWYDYRTGMELDPPGRFISLSAPLDYINLHVRGGTIIPKQNPAVTTTLSRKNPMSLLVALDGSDNAEGVLYWDDGESRSVGENFLLLKFSCSSPTLDISVDHMPLNATLTDGLHFERITIYGVENVVTSVVIDSSEGSGETPLDFTFVDSVLDITNIDLSIASDHSVSWS